LLLFLRAFNDDEHYGDWSGAGEFVAYGEDQIPDCHAVIERGTIQQGIAEVVRAAATPVELLQVAGDVSVPLSERRAAAALFGYLEYRRPLSEIEQLVARETDAPLHALLRCVHYWLTHGGT